MSLRNGFFLSLQRLYANGKLRDIKRAEEEWLHTSFSAMWIKDEGRPLASLPAEEQAKRHLDLINGINRIVGIILGNRPFHISYIVEDKGPYELKENRALAISIEPLEHPPTAYSFYDSVDTITGQVIHEAAHLRENQGTKTPIEHDKILFALHHLVEDVIIDSIIAKELPGFEGYLLKYRHYLCSEKLSKKWGRRVDSRLQMTILALRSAQPFRISRPTVRRAYLYMIYLLERHRSIEELRRLDRSQVARNLFSILYDEASANHWKDIDYLTERFVLGADGPPTIGENGHHQGGSENLKPLSSGLFREPLLDTIELFDNLKVTDTDVDHIQQRARIGATSQKWLNEFSHEYTEGKKRQSISQEQNDLVEKMRVERTLQREGTDGQYAYHVRMSVPPLYYDAARRYREAVEAVNSQIVSLRNRFTWANTKKNANQYGLLTGNLDEDALFKAKYSAQLFAKPFVHNHLSRKMDICVMVDNSHSMKEKMEGSDMPKYIVARQMAAMFVEALERVDSIRTWVYAYSAEDQTVEIHELYSPGANAAKERIGDLYPRNNTPEYEALLTITEHMQTMARPGVQQVFIVISDGNPEDSIIPMEVQLAKIRKLAKKLQQAGHIVMQVTLGPDVLSRHMYPHYLLFPEAGYPELIRRFSIMLKKLLDQPA